MTVTEQFDNSDMASGREPFPVVDSATFHPVRRRFFRSARRSPQELPTQSGGTVLVFQSNNRFALAPPGPAMLRSDVAVLATAAVVVSVKQQLVPLMARFVSANRQESVQLYATFCCLVTNPVRVLESGCFDVRPALRRHLLADPTLRMYGSRDDVDNPEVAQRILARALARNALQPPAVPGMQVDLVDLTLGTGQSGWVNGDYTDDVSTDVHPLSDSGYDDDPFPEPYHGGDRPPRDGYYSAPPEDR